MIGFWIFMLLSNLLIPLLMIGFGTYFLNRAPKEINDLFGYRTTMSKKNKDTWAFAHRYCGKLWRITGWVLFPLSVIAMLLVFGKEIDTVGSYGVVVCLLQLIPLTVTIIQTERALKQTFDKDGTPRQ